jgi:hypothetical protein
MPALAKDIKRLYPELDPKADLYGGIWYKLAWTLLSDFEKKVHTSPRPQSWIFAEIFAFPNSSFGSFWPANPVFLGADN